MFPSASFDVERKGQELISVTDEEADQADDEIFWEAPIIQTGFVPAMNKRPKERFGLFLGILPQFREFFYIVFFEKRLRKLCLKGMQ